MSDQGYTSAGEDGDVCCCCTSCSSTQRKFGYYITLLLGLFLYAFGIINLFGLIFGDTGASIFIIFGGLFIILHPLWIKSFAKLLADMKNPIRITSTLFFVISLVGLIITKFIISNTILIIVFLILSVISGLWYFLSFFENGQAACLGCLKTCCKGKEGGEATA